MRIAPTRCASATVAWIIAVALTACSDADRTRPTPSPVGGDPATEPSAHAEDAADTSADARVDARVDTEGPADWLPTGTQSWSDLSDEARRFVLAALNEGHLPGPLGARHSLRFDSTRLAALLHGWATVRVDREAAQRALATEADRIRDTLRGTQHHHVHRTPESELATGIFGAQPTGLFRLPLTSAPGSDQIEWVEFRITDWPLFADAVRRCADLDLSRARLLEQAPKALAE